MRFRVPSLIAELVRPAMLDRLVSMVLTYRWRTIALAGLVMIVLAAGVRFIGVTNDYRSLFDRDDPYLAAFSAFEQVYGASNLALIAVAPRDGTVFAGEALAVLEEVTDAAWTTPYSTRVDSLANFSHSRAEGDELIVEALIEDAASLEADDIGRIKAIALGEPELVGRLVSRDGGVAGVVITFALPDDPDAAVVEITDHLAGILDRAGADYPGMAFHLTGDVPLNRAFADATRDDLETLTPVVFLVMLAATALLLRSLSGTLAIFVMLGFVINSTVGVAGWVGTVFNPVNSGVPIIVMTVAVAHSVHIVSATLSALDRGLVRREAIAEALRMNAWPVFLTSLTTMIGFLSLNFSNSPPFRVLGSLVAFGVFCAFVYSLTLLPALLSVLPLRSRARGSAGPALFERFGGFVIARRGVLLGCCTLVALVLVTGIHRIELTDNWTRYLGERYQFRRDTDFVIGNLTGMETLEYSLASGSEGGITDPAYLQRVEAFAGWFRRQPEVFHVQAFSDIMKRLNRNMHGDEPSRYHLPDSPELAAQFLLLYEFSLPVGRDLNDRIDVARSNTRMTVVMRSLTSRQQLELDRRAQGWIRENAPGLSTEATGVTIVFAHLSQTNIRSMLTGTIAAMALISLILVLVFRSVLLGLVSLVPNFIPAALSFGIWGYLVGRVGLAGSVMTAIAFGIIVDDTIHFLSKYLKARRGGAAPADAVRSTFAIVGHAMWTTTVVLCLGFLVFAASGFEISWALGLLVTLTIFIALLADFLLLPPLLMAVDRK